MCVRYPYGVSSRYDVEVAHAICYAETPWTLSAPK